MTNAQTLEDQEILKSYETFHEVKNTTENNVENSVNQENKNTEVVNTTNQETKPEAKNESKPEENKVVITDEQLNEYFKTKHGKTLEEFTAELEEAKKPKPIEFKNEKLKKAYEWVEEKGGDWDEFNTIHNTNWDKVADDVLVLAKMKKENPDLSDEEVQQLYDYTYRTDAEKYGEDDAKVGALKRKQDAAKARTEYKTLQEQAKEPASYKSAEDARQKAEAAQKLWEKDVTSTLQTFKGVNEQFKTATGLEVNFEFKPDQAQIKDLQEILNNPTQIFKGYRNKDGSTDLNRFAKDMFLFKNRDKWASDLVAQTEEQYVRVNLKNTDFSGKHKQTAPNATIEAERAQLATQYFT